MKTVLVSRLLLAQQVIGSVQLVVGNDRGWWSLDSVVDKSVHVMFCTHIFIHHLAIFLFQLLKSPAVLF